MANLNPYVKTVKTYNQPDIEGWQVVAMADDTTVTAELRGKKFLVSPVQTGGGEQNHHELEIGIEGPPGSNVRVHLGHAQNDTLFDRVVSTYHYSIDLLTLGTGFITKSFNAAYGGRRASWWLIELKDDVKVTFLRHKYFESHTTWLHGPVNQQVDYMGGRMRYSVALPPNYDPERANKYPLMISVGGSGELGDDGRILGQVDPGCICCKNAAVYTQYPTIHVTVQIPTGGFDEGSLPDYEGEYPYHDGWRRTYAGDRYGGIGIRLVVEKLLEEMHADPDRVYMSGFSGGGIMSFEMMKYGRDLFAAFVPVGGWPIGRAYEIVTSHMYWNRVPLTEVNSMRTRLMKEIYRARHLSSIVGAGSSDGMRHGTKAYHDVGVEEFGIDCQFKLVPTSHGGSPKLVWNDITTMTWIQSKVRDSYIPDDFYADGDYDKPIPTRNYPMIELTAEDQGYFRVFVDDVEVSKHVSEREASQRATNEKLKDPEVTVYYNHDYRVDVSYTPPEVTDDEPTDT